MDEDEKLTFIDNENEKEEVKIQTKKDITYLFLNYLLITFFLIFITIIICLFYLYINYNNNALNKANKEIKLNKNHKFSILLPGNNCPNKNLKTLYLKRKDYNNNLIQELDKNINISSIKYYEQTFFTKTKSEFREVKLKELGLKLKEKMDIHNLYILPYSVGKKLKKEIQKNIINKYQKIDRFFNYFEYVSKSSLYNNYKHMSDIFPLEYNYMLETYSYPEDKEIINQKFKNYKYDNNTKDNLWLIKPKIGSLGNRISILKDISKIKKGYLITKYLYNPHLIRGYKYDLRIHGLVTSIKPLKIYLYNEGLVRLATEKYDQNNQNNDYSILTNLFINRKNKNKFVYPKNYLI